MRKSIFDISCPHCGKKTLTIDWMATGSGGDFNTKTGEIHQPEELDVSFEIIHCQNQDCNYDSYTGNELLEKEEK